MSIKSGIRSNLLSSTKGQILFYRLRKIRERMALLTTSDEKYIRRMYKKRFGEELNLCNPVSFGAKLQWLKLFYRDPQIVRCSDKFEIRGYMEDRGLGWLCNDLIGTYVDAKDIDFGSLPDSFVAKANHGSGWNLIVKNKNELDWPNTVELMNSWLDLNLYVFGREWNYRDIEPKIVIEKYLDHEPLNDYKFMCFNGEPLYMQLNNDFEGSHYVDFYDLEGWRHLPITYSAYKKSDREVAVPEQYETMLELARQLSAPFPFVRVDFYNFDQCTILGEMTFFPAGGLWPLKPSELGFNEILGSRLELPEPNYNLDLYERVQREGR